MPSPYYDEGGITIYHGDCREILPAIPMCDLLLTDPPYGVRLGNHTDAKRIRPGVGLKKQAYESYDDTLDNFISIVVPAVTIALGAVSRGIVFCADKNLRLLPAPNAISAIFLPAGLGRTPWGFRNLAHFALYGTAPDLNLGAKNTAIRSTEAAEKNGHPCPKPLGWMKWLVTLGSRQGETVLDPFMGSGTTLVAARLQGRRAVGIEIEEKYCEIAVKRLAQGVLDL